MGGVMRDDARELARPRWRGQPGRVETWYATFTDPATGDGYWMHAEVHAPIEGDHADAHGWFAAFPREGPPLVARFGPEAVIAAPGGPDWFDAAGCRVGPGQTSGSAGDLVWDLEWEDDSAPLCTFPRGVWDRELLPGQQLLPAPAATFRGRVHLGDRGVDLRGARGGLAHIYGHGHAQRWGWLHADLSQGEGDDEILEIVAAVSRRPGLRLLPPVAFVQLRAGGVDWPANPLATAPLFRSSLALPRWTVRGVVGRRRLRVAVTLPEERSVSLRYTDPDGSPATCTNSERADVDVSLDHFEGGWRRARSWTLEGLGHAEVGLRT
jgi:hypothetical protein